MMIKICGITNCDDALAAIGHGASALGFNFYPGSPRYLPPDRAADLLASLPPGALKVGLFVNEPPAHVAALARRLSLDVVQLHGEESPAAYPPGLRVWKAARVDAAFQLASLERIPAEAVLLDGPAGTVFGGSGESFDWRLVASSPRRLIIAGGLDATNVGQAIRAAHPWGVDACSRLESAPGRKDHVKLAAFLKAAREEPRT